MKNVPWHEQVIEFCSQLTDQLEHYSIACEHEHSNCVLIAHHKFKSDENGVAGWKTWIDYPKFQHLYDEWKTNGTEFEALDYSGCFLLILFFNYFFISRDANLGGVRL